MFQLPEMPRFECGPHQSIGKSSDFDNSSISSFEHFNKALNISLDRFHDVVTRVNDQFMHFVEVIALMMHNASKQRCNRRSRENFFLFRRNSLAVTFSCCSILISRLY